MHHLFIVPLLNAMGVVNRVNKIYSSCRANNPIRDIK